MDEYRNPLFTKKISTKKPLVEGEELVVQVSREALKTKEPAVTTNLNFTGKYAVLTTENQTIGFSKKMDQKTKERLKTLLQDHLPQGFGLIVRTNCIHATEEQILNEMEQLAKEAQNLKEKAPYQMTFQCVKKQEPFYVNVLKNLYSHQLEEISYMMTRQ